MKKFISVFLCIVLFLLFNLSLALFCVSRFSSVNFATKVINDVDVKDTVESIRESDNSEVSSILDNVYEKASDHGFSEEQVNNILESDMVKEVLEKYSSNLLLDGQGLTEGDINDIVSNNVDEIIENSNGTLKEEDRGEIIRVTETMAPTIASKLPDGDKISEMTGGKIKLDANKNKVKDFSYLFYIALVLAVIVLGIIILLQRKKFKWLLYTGVTILVSSIVALLFTFLGGGLINLVISGQEEVIRNVINPIVLNFTKVSYITLGICLVLSIIEIVSYNILKKEKY